MQVGKARLLDRWSKLKQPVLTHLQCPICDHFNEISQFKVYTTEDLFWVGTLIRYQCPNCDVIFGDLRFLNLSNEEIGNDYLDLYSCYSEGDPTVSTLAVLKLSNTFDKSKTYCDWACGSWNTVVPSLKAEGYNVVGYDRYCSPKDYILREIGDRKFDVIFSNNYIEHVIHPYEDLKEIISHVNQGGYLIFITQCFDYRIEYTHYHTFFFIGKSISVLCSKLNIELVNTINTHDTTGKVFKVL